MVQGQKSCSEGQQLSGKIQGAISGGASIFSGKYSLCTDLRPVHSKYFPEKRSFRQENGSWEACFFWTLRAIGGASRNFRTSHLGEGVQQIHIMSNMVLWCRPSLCKPSPLKKIPVPQLSFYFFRSVGPRPNLIDPIIRFGNFRGEDHLPIMVGNLGIFPLLFCPSLSGMQWGTTIKWKNPRCNFRWSQYFFRKIFAVHWP